MAVNCQRPTFNIIATFLLQHRLHKSQMRRISLSYFTHSQRTARIMGPLVSSVTQSRSAICSPALHARPLLSGNAPPPSRPWGWVGGWVTDMPLVSGELSSLGISAVPCATRYYPLLSQRKLSRNKLHPVSGSVRSGSFFLLITCDLADASAKSGGLHAKTDPKPTIGLHFRARLIPCG